MNDLSRGREGGKPTAAAEIRAAWERIANEVLEQGGHAARIDRRSLKQQGIDRTASVHQGPAATRLKRELARHARELAVAEMTALRQIAAIQQARGTTPPPSEVHADIGSLAAWERDALGMLARYWQAEDRAMQLRRKMRASARRHSEMRAATAEEERALRAAGRRLSRARTLLHGLGEVMERIPAGVTLDLEASDRPLTKARLKAIRQAIAGRARPHAHEMEVSL